MVHAISYIHGCMRVTRTVSELGVDSVVAAGDDVDISQSESLVGSAPERGVHGRLCKPSIGAAGGW